MKVIALSIVLSLAVSPCHSQDHPFVEEGKIWNMVFNNPEASDSCPDYQFCYYIKGDTLISGLNCKKLYVYNENNNDSTVYLMSLFEENRKVFFIPKDSTISFVLYDFGIPVGGKFTIDDAIHPEWKLTMRNTEEKNVSTQAFNWRCWLVNRVIDDGSEVANLPAVTWIEGVGSELGPLATWQFGAAGNNSFLSYCDLNGRRIFSISEFKDSLGKYKSLPLLPEGKVWNYVYHHLGNDGWQLDPYSYTVRGDSVIGSKTYKKIYRQDEEKEWLPFMLREENGALYKLYSGETDEFLLFDFKRQDIGTLTSWISSFGAKRVNWMIDAIDTVQVGDNSFRRFSCRQQYSDAPLSTIEDGPDVGHDYWVEGIGSASEGIEASSLEIPLRLPGVYNTFASCYVDGVCVFTADDFKGHHNDCKMLSDGKVWNYKVDYLDLGEAKSFEYKEWISGDTIISGQTYWKMSATQPEVPLYTFRFWREEDNRVYAYQENTGEELLIYDFNLRARDETEIFDYKGLIVGYDDVVTVQGVDRRHLVLYIDGSVCSTWLEGVGTPGLLAEPLGHEVSNGVIIKLLSCYEGDTCIFDESDRILLGIGSANIERQGTDAVYDLRGQRLSSPRKGINIIRRGDGTVRKELVK